MKFHFYPKCVLLFTSCLLAQQTPRRSSVRGEVRGYLPADAQVEISACTGGGAAGYPASAIHPSGSFELRDVEPGCYRVSVVAGTSGHRLYESIHDLSGTNGSLELRLRESENERPAASGISLAALRPKPSKKAARLLEDAGRLSRQGDYQGAAVKLRQAIEREPAFAEAHINLGAQLMRLGQPEAALAEFEQGRLLGIASAPLLTNIAAAHLELRRLPESEAALRDAFRADADYPQAHFILAQVLLRQKQSPQLALQHFRRAAGLPGARIMVAQLLAHLGQREAAAAELRIYLESGHPTYRPAAEKLLLSLRP